MAFFLSTNQPYHDTSETLDVLCILQLYNNAPLLETLQITVK